MNTCKHIVLYCIAIGNKSNLTAIERSQLSETSEGHKPEGCNWLDGGWTWISGPGGCVCVLQVALEAPPSPPPPGGYANCSVQQILTARPSPHDKLQILLNLKISEALTSQARYSYKYHENTHRYLMRDTRIFFEWLELLNG